MQIISSILLLQWSSVTSSLLTGGGGGGGTWVKFCWVCAAGISEPLPHYSLFLVYSVANYKPHLSHFWANDFLTLKVPKKCDPILVTIENAWKDDPIIVSRVVKMRPHPAAHPQ